MTMSFRVPTQFNEKSIFIIIGALVGVFLIYNLFLSPYQQCIRGYVDLHYNPEYNYSDPAAVKKEYKAETKIHCKALER